MQVSFIYKEIVFCRIIQTMVDSVGRMYSFQGSFIRFRWFMRYSSQWFWKVVYFIYLWGVLLIFLDNLFLYLVLFDGMYIYIFYFQELIVYGGFLFFQFQKGIGQRDVRQKWLLQFFQVLDYFLFICKRRQVKGLVGSSFLVGVGWGWVRESVSE